MTKCLVCDCEARARAKELEDDLWENVRLLARQCDPEMEAEAEAMEARRERELLRTAARAEVAKMRRERDEARAELERLREERAEAVYDVSQVKPLTQEEEATWRRNHEKCHFLPPIHSDLSRLFATLDEARAQRDAARKELSQVAAFIRDRVPSDYLAD